MRSIVRGPLWDEFEASQRTSLLLNVKLPPLGPAFIPKGKVGRHFKSISRNGLVILMSTFPPRDVPNSTAVHLRVAVWHRSHLQDDPAMAYGLLLHVQPLQGISTRANVGTAPKLLHLILPTRRSRSNSAANVS